MDTIEKLKDSYNLLTEQLISRAIKGDFDYVYTFLRGADFFGGYINRLLHQGNKSLFRCDAGRNRVGVDYNGNMYACSVYLGNKDFLVGDVDNGFNENRKTFEKSTINNERCKNCFAKYICAGECYAISYQSTKELSNPNELICELKKHLIKLAIYFWNKLKKEHYEAYKNIPWNLYQKGGFLAAFFR